MPRKSKTKTDSRRLRLHFGLNQEQWAKALGVSKSFVNSVECGNNSYGTRVLNLLSVLDEKKTIAEIIGEQMSQLIDDERRAANVIDEHGMNLP